MALYTSCLLRNGGLLMRGGPFQRLQKLGAVSTAKCLSLTPVPQSTETEGFWEKNKRLNRPVSPHLTIYKPQITSMLSITHRGTGLYMSGIMSGFAIGMLALPGSYCHYLSVLESMHYGPACIFVLKFALAWPFMFHFANGIRHLAWDMGKGFENKEVSATGFGVLGLSSVLAFITAMM